MHFAALGGSLRKDSLNLHLLTYLTRSLASQGHTVAAITGEALRLPLYDADLPLPGAVAALRDRCQGIQGLILVSPEYNAGIPPHLKNAIDWLSTLESHPLKGLPVLLAAASPGALGGARSLLSWRPVLANLGAMALPNAITVPLADKALAADGTPLDPRSLTAAQEALTAFLDLARRLA